MSKTASIGIDIGGTKTLMALFDASFQVIEVIKTKTPADDRDEFISRLSESIRQLEKKAAKEKLEVAAIGAGIAGSLDPAAGVILSSPNIPALENLPLQSILAELIDVPIRLANDANAGLYGEHQFGVAMGYQHVLGIFIGTGVGGALVIGGKLHTGATGVAGDIGHYLLQPLGPLAGSDTHGMLDDISSRTAISGEAAVLAAKHSAPNLLEAAGTDIRNIRSSELAAAIQKGDEKIEELVRSRCQILGIILSNFVDFINPEMIVLGGGLTDAMPSIVRKEVQAGIEAHTTAAAKAGLKVVTTKLKEHSVTTGAAKMAIDSV